MDETPAAEAPIKKKRGRPPKNATTAAVKPSISKTELKEKVTKRRGRPKLVKSTETDQNSEEPNADNNNASEDKGNVKKPAIKRKRGRPSKTSTTNETEKPKEVSYRKHS